MDDRGKIGPVAAAELALLVDALLPGDELFPAATAVGVHALLGSRLEQLRGALALAELAGAISDAGGPLGVLDEAGRTAAVAKIQRRYAALFDDVLRVAFLTYYEFADCAGCRPRARLQLPRPSTAWRLRRADRPVRSGCRCADPRAWAVQKD